MAAEIITIASLKRGAGKTVTARALATAAARSGLRVIAVDLDPTGGVSAGVERGATAATIADVVRREAALEDALVMHPLGYETVPGDRRIGAEHATGLQLQAVLRPALDACDLMLVDSAADEEQVVPALEAADRTVIVAGLDILSMRAAALTAGLAEEAGALDRVCGLVICNAPEPMSQAESMLLAALGRSGIALETVLPHCADAMPGQPPAELVARAGLLLRELALREPATAPLAHFVALAQGRHQLPAAV